MIKAIKDYWNMIMKPNSKWVSIHWKGYVIFNLLIYLWLMFGNIIGHRIKYFIKKFVKD